MTRSCEASTLTVWPLALVVPSALVRLCRETPYTSTSARTTARDAD